MFGLVDNEIDQEIIDKNTMIWSALNKLEPKRYSDIVNDGKGLAHFHPRDYSGIGMHGNPQYYTYFNNSWNDIMPAMLTLGVLMNFKNMDEAYDQLYVASKLIMGL